MEELTDAQARALVESLRRRTAHAGVLRLCDFAEKLLAGAGVDVKPRFRTQAGRFDKTAYQRHYMRQRRTAERERKAAVKS